MVHARERRLWLLLAAAGMSLAAASGDPAPLLTIADERISESSGLVASRAHAGSLWTHNDSGEGSRLFLVGSDGRTRSVYRLDVADARDWESMTASVDDRGATILWVGDIGDNNGVRTRGTLVHRVVEPKTLRARGTLSATSYRLVYEDGPHDAEAMFIGPDGRLRVVTKNLFGAGGVFLGPTTLSATKANVLRRIADAPALITDATALTNGGYALRDYASAYLYDAKGALQGEIALPEQPQGESMALSADGKSLLVGSEGARSDVWRVPLPTTAAGAASAPSEPSVDPAPTAKPTSAGREARSAGDDGVMTRVAVAAAGLVLLGCGLGLSARRRRHR